MAANYIPGDRGNSFYSQRLSLLRQLRDARDSLVEQQLVLDQARDGDGSSAAHYDMAAVQFGFQSGDYATPEAACKASYDELASLLAKLTTDASVSAVMTATNQACAKHGV